MSEPHASATRRLEQAMMPSLIAAGIGALLLILGLFFEPGQGMGFHPGQVLRSWLFGWVFWFGLSVGCMGIVMMQRLTGGGWGYLVRRFGETAGMVVPVLAILFVPVILGVRYIYPWADPSQVAQDAVLRHKASFLNWPSWTGRSVIYLAIFTVLTWMLSSSTLNGYREPSPQRTARLRRLSAGGLVIYFFAMALGGVDWIMSREPHWDSTIFGFILVVSQALTATCFLILALAYFVNEPPLKEMTKANHLNDLGSILVMFVILWAYMSFGQFLIIWLGNKQDEIIWYIRRTDGGWRWVAAALIAFHFLIPFILLLQRSIKRKIGPLAAVAAGLLLMRYIDVLYWVTPGDSMGAVWSGFHWFYSEIVNAVAWITVGGVWIAAFIWLLRGKPLIPVGEYFPVAPKDHGKGQQPISETLA